MYLLSILQVQKKTCSGNDRGRLSARGKDTARPKSQKERRMGMTKDALKNKKIRKAIARRGLLEKKKKSWSPQMSNAKATLFRGQRWAECARGCMGVGDNGRATAEWRHGRCRTRVSTFWSVKVQIVSIFRFMNDTAPITTTLCYCITKATTETLEANGRVSVRINLYLWTLNFEFQRSFTCHKIFFFSIV